MLFFRKAFTTLSHTDRTPQVLLDAAQCHAATGDIATGVALAEEAKAQQDDLPFVDQCLKAWAPEKCVPAWPLLSHRARGPFSRTTPRA